MRSSRWSWVVVAGLACGASAAGGEEGEAALKEAFGRGEWARTIELCDAVLADDPAHPTAMHHKGFALHALGRLDEALAVHVRAAELPVVGATAAYNAGCVHALRGEPDLAFAWLDRAAAKGFDQAAHALRDPDLASLRDDPRFEAFLGRLDATGAPRTLKPYSSVTERMGARLSFYDGKTSPGQLHLDWGRVEWDDAWDAKLASGDLDGTRWRFGKDFWTTLDTSVDLTLGDETIPAGHHFLVLARQADGRFALIVLDPERIRTHAFDPSVAHLTPFVGGTEIPLAHRRVEEPAPLLRMEFVPDEGDGTEGELRVRFGPHELGVEYGVALGESKESNESNESNESRGERG